LDLGHIFSAYACVLNNHDLLCTNRLHRRMEMHQRRTMMLSDEQIKHMVDRFLQWRLPENFNPDGGISFKKTFNENTPYPMKHEPVGTNLLDAMQAEEMIRYMVEGMPSERQQPAQEQGIESGEMLHRLSVVQLALLRNMRSIASSEEEAQKFYQTELEMAEQELTKDTSMPGPLEQPKERVTGLRAELAREK
jgi:hypothetical protein